MSSAWPRIRGAAVVSTVMMLAVTPLAAQPAAAPGPAIQRVANLPDGSPAFEVFDARRQRMSRIECIWNGWYDADTLASRLLASTTVMAAVIAKGGRIAIEDLGPAVFDCTVVHLGAAR